jgi:flagellar assembly factor FliW
MDAPQDPAELPGTAIGLTFPDGLVGLPELVRFAREPIEGTVFHELISLDDPTFRFAAASADDVRPGVTAELIERGLAPEGAEVLVLLAVHGDPPGVTANLAGPLVIDPESRSARQLVLEDAAFQLRVPIATAG